MKNKNNGFDYLSTYDSIHHFLKETEERIFRFWVYKRMFTPYEQDRMFKDADEYVNTTARIGIIREAVVLPDGDVLLGLAEIYCDVAELCELLEEETRHLTYYKLSEIRLGYYPHDVKEYNYGT